MIFAMLFLTISCALLLVMGIIFALPKLLNIVPAEDFLLIVPLSDDSAVEMSLKKAIYLVEGPCTKGVKILAVDMGLSDEGLKICELISKNKSYITLCKESDIKNFLSLEKSNSQMTINDI